MIDETLIKVSDLSKTFVLPHEKHGTLKSIILNKFRNIKSFEKQKALTNINLEVKRGEFLGIVGRNGGGKSTLLKLIAGIYNPTKGAVMVNGKLTPFIELGVGFNPELSGRDNVYLNGALLGFNTKEVNVIYDEIVAFAELGKFMDQKLKNYSSGMLVRLAFSIAIKAKSDILLLDEVLAVGDAAFQQKCRNVFDKYKETKQTIVLVTHDMETVKEYCTRAVLLNKGRLVSEGDPQKVADEYSKLNQNEIDIELENNNKSSENIHLELIDIKTKKKKTSFDIEENFALNAEWPKFNELEYVLIDLFKSNGIHISSFGSLKDGVQSIANKTKATVVFNPKLSPGNYYFNITLRDKNDKELQSAYRLVNFSIKKDWTKSSYIWSGLVYVEHSWKDVK